MNKKSLLLKVLKSTFTQLAMLCCLLLSASASSLKPNAKSPGFIKSDGIHPEFAVGKVEFAIYINIYIAKFNALVFENEIIEMGF